MSFAFIYLGQTNSTMVSTIDEEIHLFQRANPNFLLTLNKRVILLECEIN